MSDYVERELEKYSKTIGRFFKRCFSSASELDRDESDVFSDRYSELAQDPDLLLDHMVCSQDARNSELAFRSYMAI